MSRKILFGGSFAALLVLSGAALADAPMAPPAPAAPEAVSVQLTAPDIAAMRSEAIASLRAARVEIRNAVREQRAAMAALAAQPVARPHLAAIRAQAAASVRVARVEIVKAMRQQSRVLAAVAAAAAAPPAPPAPRAAPAVPATPAAAVPQVLRTAPRSFEAAKAIDVSGVYGVLTVEVAPGPVTVVLTARKTVLDRVTFRMEEGTLHVSEHSGVDGSWDIFRWLGYGDHSRNDRLDVRVRVPRGTPVVVDGFVGNLAIGDIEAPVKLELAVTNGTVGNVTRASVEMAGSGKVRIARVSGPLTAELAGAGALMTGPVGSADVEIAGSGSAALGAVSGGIKATIAGSGDVAAASVNGPIRVEIAGSGSVKIASGMASALNLEIMGSGDFDFGGEAVNPHVEVLGSGRVRIKSYRGSLTTEGTSNVQIGSR